MGLFKLLMTLLSVWLVDRCGRRPLLLGGTTAMALMLSALSALFALGGEEGPNQNLVALCVVAFVGGYQIGFGPVTWLILSEVHWSTELRVAHRNSPRTVRGLREERVRAWVDTPDPTQTTNALHSWQLLRPQTPFNRHFHIHPPM